MTHTVPLALVILLAGQGTLYAEPRRSAGGHGHHGRGAASCEAARADIQAACPCDAAPQHGAYVRCVVRAVKAMAARGALAGRCRGKLVRCAARSTCGKPGTVACLAAHDTCDVLTQTCGDDPERHCSTDLGCAAGCRIAPSLAACQAAGGTPGTGSTCCASASGAFLDSE